MLVGKESPHYEGIGLRCCGGVLCSRVMLALC